MKGVVFTEFLEMVEKRFDLAMVDRIISAADLSECGAYTSVGTYPHEELLRLVAALSAATGTPAPELVQGFGEHLFGRFAMAYHRFFDGVRDAFEFLDHVQDYIHVEVRKLYPEAELPTFTTELRTPERMILLYESRRPFADLAEGLLRGCGCHFGETIHVVRENLAAEGLTRTRFILTRSPQHG